MIILNTIGVAFLNIIIGLLLRVIIGGVIFNFIRINALVSGVPFLGIVALFYFPGFSNQFQNFGFYLVDICATVMFVYELIKKNKENTNAKSN